MKQQKKTQTLNKKPNKKTNKKSSAKGTSFSKSTHSGGRRRPLSANKKLTSTDLLVRLNKFIADSGHCSRRAADQLIDEGRVTVNGRKVFELGVKVDPKKDKVAVDKKTLSAAHKNFVYFVMNKPVQVLTSMSDPSGRPTVADYFHRQKNKRLFPVGRLDWDSEGLLIMTNDGDYSQKITHPKEGIPKTYHVKVDKELTEPKKQKLLSGVTIVGGKVSATEVFRMKKNMRGQKTFWVSITITEGKNRQVRRMFEKIGLDVLKLRRVSIGGLKIGALKSGQVLQMTTEKAMKVFETPRPKAKNIPTKS